MARCNCGTQGCTCRLQAGQGAALSGSGTARDPWVISLEGGGSSSSDWQPGDLKDTTRASTAPGWLECNGQAVSRATYADLFAAIGTTYGAGNGTTTFNVPNYAGIFRLGAGAAYPQGSSGGNASTTLQVANLPPHTHSINHDHGAFSTADGGAHRHKLLLTDSGGSNAAVAQGKATGGTETSNPVESTGTHSHSINVPVYVGSSGSTGAASSFSNLPPYRAVRVLIKT